MDTGNIAVSQIASTPKNPQIRKEDGKVTRQL